MKKKNFTLIELLVVITIIAILAAMLFPTFGKMQRKAQQNNSVNLSKQHVGSVIGYFTDARKKYVPGFDDAVGTLSEAMALCPAGGGDNAATATSATAVGDYGYVAGATAAATAFNVPTDGIVNTAYGAFTPGTTKWLVINNDQSPIVNNESPFTQTATLKGVGYGDGHAGIVGEE